MLNLLRAIAVRFWLNHLLGSTSVWLGLVTPKTVVGSCQQTCYCGRKIMKVWLYSLSCTVTTEASLTHIMFVPALRIVKKPIWTWFFFWRSIFFSRFRAPGPVLMIKKKRNEGKFGANLGYLSGFSTLDPVFTRSPGPLRIYSRSEPRCRSLMRISGIIHVTWRVASRLDFANAETAIIKM